MYMDFLNYKGIVFKVYYCAEMRRYLSKETYACARFVERQNRGCYLTSACVEYKGLSDDCYELTTLRSFRDNYVAKLENGGALIQKYYETAPTIVQKINKAENKNEIYNRMYDYILICVEQIEKENYENALDLYKNMVEKFSEKFLKENI